MAVSCSIGPIETDKLSDDLRNLATDPAGACLMVEIAITEQVQEMSLEALPDTW
jgi:hypothetical protein